MHEEVSAATRPLCDLPPDNIPKAILALALKEEAKEVRILPQPHGVGIFFGLPHSEDLMLRLRMPGHMLKTLLEGFEILVPLENPLQITLQVTPLGYCWTYRISHTVLETDLGRGASFTLDRDSAWPSPPRKASENPGMKGHKSCERQCAELHRAADLS